MNNFNFVGPYDKEDSTLGHLSTIVTSSKFVETYLSALPVYRKQLLPCYFRGLEIGMAHGYFLIGPFYKLGPLRNSEIALMGGYLSTIGLIIILSLALLLYGNAYYGNVGKSTKVYRFIINQYFSYLGNKCSFAKPNEISKTSNSLDSVNYDDTYLIYRPTSSLTNGRMGFPPSGQIVKVNELNSYKGWTNFTGGFFIGALGGSWFAFLLLS